MNNNQIKAFLSELTELSKRHRIEIELAENLVTGQVSICISEIHKDRDLSKFSYSVITAEVDSEFSICSGVIGDHLSFNKSNFESQTKGEL